MSGNSEANVAHRSPAQRIGIGLTIVLVPLLLLALPLPPTRGKWAIHKQDWILTASLLIAAASAVLHFVHTPLFPHRRSIWPLILLGTALLVSADVVWNKAFRNYAQDHPKYRHEVFRDAMVKTLHWPIYGRYDNAIARYEPEQDRYSLATLPFVLLGGAIASGWYLWARRRALDRPWDAKSLAILIAFMVATSVAFARCEQGIGRFALDTSGYGEFAKDMRRFKGVRGTLRHYVERMPTLEWYGQHYPPGNLILLQIEDQIGLPGMTKGVVILLTALSVIPLSKLAREIELSPAATSATLLLFAASTSVLVLSTVNTTSMLVFPGTMCLWLLCRALKRQSIAAAAWLGAFYFAYLMLSFSASILGVLMALLAAMAWWRGAIELKSILKTAVVSILTLGCIIIATYLVTKFNLIACFHAAVRGHQEQQGNGGFDDVGRYLLRSSGNILAYLTSTVPLCVLAAAALAPARRDRQHLLAFSAFTATALTILVAGFSGLFYLETERIWIFLTPALALAAGYETARREALEEPRFVRAMLMLVMVISCTQEFLFMHYR